MAKLRKNHQRNSNPFVGLSVRVFVIIAILVVLFFMAQRFFQNVDSSEFPNGQLAVNQNIEREYVPKSDWDEEIVHHQYYSLGYNEKYEISRWVAYIITKEDLKVPNVKRYRDYIVDPLVSTKSAHYKDYTNSGYTRGHLAPAGDMAFDKTAMKESFYMTNITPQKREFNNGIWKELEESVRDWAYKNEKLYIVTGPIMKSVNGDIGRNRVGVPTLFYKAILDYSGSEHKAIGFIIPNDVSDRKLSDYAVSIDEIEASTGLDLFEGIYSGSGNHLEEDYNVKKWKLSSKRHKLRVNKWNKE